MSRGRILTTRRLRLEPLDRGHAGEMHRLWSDADVRRFLWDDRVISIGTAIDVLRTSESDFNARGFGLWGIALVDAPPHVGFVGLRGGDCNGASELLYGLLRHWWGSGLATEACRAVLDYAFGTLALPRVEAAADWPNVASARVMQRLGMRFVRRGVLNGLDTVFYEVLRDHWQAHGDSFVSPDR